MATVDAPITTLNGFEAERERWDRLYGADPRSQVFISWAWLRAYLNGARSGWRILVVREGDALVAALPLRITRVPSALLPIARQLMFASSPVADYQSMLCLPGRESEAIAAFAGAIGRLSWDRARFTDVADSRLLDLLAHVQAAGDRVETLFTSRCIRTALPASWDAYLKTLGAGTRGTTLRALRRLREDLPGFRITMPSGADVDAHVEAHVKLNHLRWGGNLRSSRAKYGRLHRAAYDRGCLRMFVLWDAERPIASAVSYVDAVRGTYNLYQLGLDPAYGKYSPGKGVIGVAIRDAIEHGFTVFDFLRGYEEYKLAYAKDVVTTTHHDLARRRIRAQLYDAVQPTYRTVKQAAVRIVYGPGRTV